MYIKDLFTILFFTNVSLSVLQLPWFSTRRIAFILFFLHWQKYINNVIIIHGGSIMQFNFHIDEKVGRNFKTTVALIALSRKEKYSHKMAIQEALDDWIKKGNVELKNSGYTIPD